MILINFGCRKYEIIHSYPCEKKLYFVEADLLNQKSQNIMLFTLDCRYRNYPLEQLVDIVARILAMVPPWTRVYRVQRDIPMPLVTSGVEKGNLRELALARMDDLGLKCRDVRTREAGIQVSRWNYCFNLSVIL